MTKFTAVVTAAKQRNGGNKSLVHDTSEQRASQLETGCLDAGTTELACVVPSLSKGRNVVGDAGSRDWGFEGKLHLQFDYYAIGAKRNAKFDGCAILKISGKIIHAR